MRNKIRDIQLGYEVLLKYFKLIQEIENCNDPGKLEAYVEELEKISDGQISYSLKLIGDHIESTNSSYYYPSGNNYTIIFEKYSKYTIIGDKIHRDANYIKRLNDKKFSELIINNRSIKVNDNVKLYSKELTMNRRFTVRSIAIVSLDIIVISLSGHKLSEYMFMNYNIDDNIVCIKSSNDVYYPLELISKFMII